MESAAELAVPLRVDSGVGANWDEVTLGNFSTTPAD